ncbi:MAG: hypothetical protein OXF39_01245, partial [Nitrospira sp.]|nr:hypothetical protein [Nitrospira sp.]
WEQGLGTAPLGAASPGLGLDLIAGWGLRALAGRAVLTPFVGVALSGENARTLNMGGRLRTSVWQVELAGQIDDAAPNEDVNYGVLLRGALRW